MNTSNSRLLSKLKFDRWLLKIYEKKNYEKKETIFNFLTDKPLKFNGLMNRREKAMNCFILTYLYPENTILKRILTYPVLNFVPTIFTIETKKKGAS